MHLQTNDSAYAELNETTREYALRWVELSSHAATSGVTREWHTALQWLDNGLRFLHRNAGQDDLGEWLKEQRHLAQNCSEQLVQDVRNTLQIAELTNAELAHWQNRWSAAWLRSVLSAF